MIAGHIKRFLSLTLALVLLCMSVSDAREAYTWYCPERGRKDNTGYYCGNCGAPEPESTETALAHAEVGDYIFFGNYEQDNDTNNGQEPVEWLILDVQEEKALLISRFGLDAQPYNTEHAEITWETCTLRSWLNDVFWEQAFDTSEKERILTTKVPNGKDQGYSEYETDGGNDTEDRLFLLSYAEAWKYFANDEARKCVLTAYAFALGADIKKDAGVSLEEWDWWWLRSPGGYQQSAIHVHKDGTLRFGDVGWPVGCVRPACWVQLAVAEPELDEAKGEPAETETEGQEFSGSSREEDQQSREAAIEAAVAAAKEEAAKTLEETKVADAAALESAVTAAKEEATRVLEETKAADAAALEAAVAAAKEEAAKVLEEIKAADAAALEAANARVAELERQVNELTAQLQGQTQTVEEDKLSKIPEIGKNVVFGHYEQDHDASNGDEAIEWLVLDVQEDKALLISRYGLAPKPYNARSKRVTWETCTLRRWLNTDFAKAAFTKNENDFILQTEVENSTAQGNSSNDTHPGNNTKDKIFLLSYQEALKYFADDASRLCNPTNEAISMGVYTLYPDSANRNTDKPFTSWWLRSPGDSRYHAIRVSSAGAFSNQSVASDSICVRPVIWVKIDYFLNQH